MTADRGAGKRLPSNPACPTPLTENMKTASERPTSTVGLAPRRGYLRGRLRSDILNVAGTLVPSSDIAMGELSDNSYNESDNSGNDDDYSDNESIHSAHSDDESIHSDSLDTLDEGENVVMVDGQDQDVADGQQRSSQQVSTATDRALHEGHMQTPDAQAAKPAGSTTKPSETKTISTSQSKSGASYDTATKTIPPASEAALTKTTKPATTEVTPTPTQTSKVSQPIPPTATRGVARAEPLKSSAEGSSPKAGTTTARPPGATASGGRPAKGASVSTKLGTQNLGADSTALREAAPASTGQGAPQSTAAKPKPPIAPPGYEIVKVRKPDGTIIRVKRPLKPEGKSEAGKAQNNGSAETKLVVQTQPTQDKPSIDQKPQKILESSAKETKPSVTVRELEKDGTTESTNSQQKYGRSNGTEPPSPQSSSRGRRAASLATRILIWTIMILLPVFFLVLGILTAVVDGKPISSSLGQGITQANQVAVSIWPIVFAALAAQALRMYASWKVERGIRMLTLEQLINSHSVAGAIKQPFLLRRVNLISVLLLCLWSLSPLAGQALLRMSYTDSAPTSQSIDLQYVDTTVSSPAFGGQSSTASMAQLVDMLYGSAILAPVPAQQASMDTWGNIKIPVLQSLGATDVNGWSAVTGQPSYSSLAGVPVAGLTEDTSLTSFDLASAYWTFGCPALIDITDNALNGLLVGSLVVNWTSPTGTMRVGIVPPLPGLTGSIYFASEAFSVSGSWQYTNCSMSQTFVQSHVSCTGKNCTVDRMRASATGPNYAPPYGVSEFLNWMMSFSAAGFPTHEASLSPTQYFLNDTSSAGKGNGLATELNLLDVPTAAFNTRLSLLLNTYWQIGVSIYSMTGASLSDATAGRAAPLTTTATSTTTNAIYRTSYPWLAILLFSSTLLLLGGIGSCICDTLTIGPDIFGFASSLAHKNRYMRVPTGDSAMSGAERTRLLGDVQVMVQDVRSGHPVGKIALGSVDNPGGARLVRGRVYK